MEPTVEHVIKVYLRLRGEKEHVEAESKQQLAVIREKMDRLTAWLHAKAQADDVSSFRTTSGTAFLSSQDSATVADGEVFMRFVLENEAFHLLDRRASKIAVRAYIDAHKEVPPGVNYRTWVDMRVNAPRATLDMPD